MDRLIIVEMFDTKTRSLFKTMTEQQRINRNASSGCSGPVRRVSDS